MSESTKKDFDWVAAVIASCTTESHLSYIPGIIDLFDRKHSSTNPQASYDLKRCYVDKQMEIGTLPY